jgi:hypothetical protein
MRSVLVGFIATEVVLLGKNKVENKVCENC